MRSQLSVLLLCASSLVSACLYKRDGEQAPWSYEGHNGPVLWHNLTPDNGLCGTGTNQSPINIDSTITTVDGSSFNYPAEADFILENNGHTVDCKPSEDEDATAFRSTLGGAEYQLLGFHFHAPSEHRVNGLGYPLEVHFVHKHVRTGDLGVFGIFFDIEASEGDDFFHQMPFRQLQAKGDVMHAEDISLRTIMAHVRTSRVFNYSGSLTTPPCSEKVNWFVAEQPLLISVDQYDALKHAVGFNSRFTQGMPGEKNLLQQSEHCEETV